MRGDPRRDLDGIETGIPTEEQRAAARRQVEWIEGKKRERRSQHSPLS